MFCASSSQQSNTSDSPSVSARSSGQMDNSSAFNNENQQFDQPPIGRRRRLTEELAILDSTSPVRGPSAAKRAKDNRKLTLDDVYRCPVCLENVRQREPCTTRCGHIFCKTCIESTVLSTHRCPLCQKKITQRQLLRIYL